MNLTRMGVYLNPLSVSTSGSFSPSIEERSWF